MVEEKNPVQLNLPFKLDVKGITLEEIDESSKIILNKQGRLTSLAAYQHGGSDFWLKTYDPESGYTFHQEELDLIKNREKLHDLFEEFKGIRPVPIIWGVGNGQKEAEFLKMFLDEFSSDKQRLEIIVVEGCKELMVQGTNRLLEKLNLDTNSIYPFLIPFEWMPKYMNFVREYFRTQIERPYMHLMLGNTRSNEITGIRKRPGKEEIRRIAEDDPEFLIDIRRCMAQKDRVVTGGPMIPKLEEVPSEKREEIINKIKSNYDNPIYRGLVISALKGLMENVSDEDVYVVFKTNLKRIEMWYKKEFRLYLSARGTRDDICDSFRRATLKLEKSCINGDRSYEIDISSPLEISLSPGEFKEVYQSIFEQFGVNEPISRDTLLHTIRRAKEEYRKGLYKPGEDNSDKKQNKISLSPEERKIVFLYELERLLKDANYASTMFYSGPANLSVVGRPEDTQVYSMAFEFLKEDGMKKLPELIKESQKNR